MRWSTIMLELHLLLQRQRYISAILVGLQPERCNMSHYLVAMEVNNDWPVCHQSYWPNIDAAVTLSSMSQYGSRIFMCPHMQIADTFQSKHSLVSKEEFGCKVGDSYQSVVKINVPSPNNVGNHWWSETAHGIDTTHLCVRYTKHWIEMHVPMLQYIEYRLMSLYRLWTLWKPYSFEMSKTLYSEHLYRSFVC